MSSIKQPLSKVVQVPDCIELQAVVYIIILFMCKSVRAMAIESNKHHVK